MIGDGAYAGDNNLKNAAENDIQIVAKVNRFLIEGTEMEKNGFTYNKDAEMMVCPAGHMATSKRLWTPKKNTENERIVYTFSRTVCNTCSRKEHCNPGKNSKKYSHPVISKTQQKQITFMTTEEFKKLSKERYKIEAKNSELKNRYGYDRADYYGLYSMKLQGAVALYASNLSRIMRMMSEK